MAAFFVVPLEELLAEGAAVLDAAEAIWKIRPVLHGSDRAAVALGDTQVGHKEVDFMTGPSVGMNGELAGRDLVLADGFLNKCLASSAPSSTRSSSR